MGSKKKKESMGALVEITGAFVVGGSLAVLVSQLANANFAYVAGIVGSAPIYDLATFFFIASSALVAQTAFANGISHIGVVVAMLIIAYFGGDAVAIAAGVAAWAVITSTVWLVKKEVFE
jgi:uncharacterized membrane protein (GlpM family)